MLLVFVLGEHHADAKLLKELQSANAMLQQVRDEQQRQAQAFEARLAALEQPEAQS